MSKGKEAGDWDGGLVLREESAAKFYLSRGVPNEPLRGSRVWRSGKESDSKGKRAVREDGMLTWLFGG